MALTKQFVSLTFLLFCLIGFITLKNEDQLSCSFHSFYFKQCLSIYIFMKTNYVTYTNDLDYVDLFLDILFS